MPYDPGLIILFRIAERLTLTAVVLIVAAIVMVGFWRTVQKIDVNDGGKLGVAGSFAFSTPVFVLLTIVGYSYVSLSHPIAVNPAVTTVGALDPFDDVATDVEGGPLVGGGGSFVGASAGFVSGAVGTQANPSEHDRAVALRKLRSLNCLALAGEMSARLTDDLAQIKLGLMRPVWGGDWGDPDQFDSWARGLTTDPPDPEAQIAFDARHPVC